MNRPRLLLATLVAYLPADALAPLAGDTPAGPLDPGAIVVPFCLGFAAGFPVWGRAADRHAPRLIVRVALLGTALTGLLVALAPTEAAIVAARALQGLAAAGVPPAVQAALASSADASQTSRALSGMMLAVALAVLGGPVLAAAIGDFRLTAAALAAASLATALALGTRKACEPAPAQRAASRTLARAAYDLPRGVHAGWLVSSLVLAGHWTVVTRLGEALGASGLGAGAGTAALASLTGAAGLPLVVLAARACDGVGPRRTMTVTLLVGAAGFALASTATTAGLFVASAGVGLAVYWAYLPVVAAQVQRSAGAVARGRAAGGLYASMWASAAAAGALATLAASWRDVLLGAGVLWALAALVAAREFLGPAQSPATCPKPAPQPSPR
jgi:MFS family permease